MNPFWRAWALNDPIKTFRQGMGRSGAMRPGTSFDEEAADEKRLERHRRHRKVKNRMARESRGANRG